MLKPRSHEVNKPKASRVRARSVSFPRSIETLSLARALVVVLVESGISNVKMKKEVRTYEKATKKQIEILKKSSQKRARAPAAQNRKKDGPFDVERMIFFLSLLSLSKIQT
jgi:hypothetical protein